MDIIPIFDGHNDTLVNILNPGKGQGRSFFDRSDIGQLDLPRAQAGGMIGGLFAIFVPPPPDSPVPDPFALTQITPQGFVVPPIQAIDPAYAERLTNQAIDLLDSLLKQGAGKIGLVRKAEDLETFLAQDTLSILLHLEGAEAVHTNLDNLEVYYQKGVRSIGPVWSRPNAFGQGVDYRFPGSPDIGGGLTAQGKQLVRACNRLGILVDLAHINEKGFWDVAKISNAPLVVSHTGIHTLSPASRNLIDTQIDAVGETGGLIGIMFEPTEIREDGRWDADMPLTQLIRHIDYVVERIGIDHIGLGSDFDGAIMPNELKDAADLPNLVQALSQRGYQGEDLEKITYRNWLRVLKDTLQE